MTPADIEQIVDAIDRLGWVQWVKQQMAADTAPGAGASDPMQATGEPAAPPPAGVGEVRPTSSMAPPTPPPPAGAPASDPGKKNDSAAAGDGSCENQDDPREREEYARLNKHYQADEQYKRYSALRKKYAADDDDDDERRRREEEDRDREEYSRLKKKYGGDASSEYQQVPPDGTKRTDEIPPGNAEPEKNGAGKRRYEAGSAGGENVDRPAQSSVDNPPQKPDEGTAGRDAGESSEPYARGGEVERYRRRVDDLEKRLETEKASRVNTERYSRLQGLRMSLAFDLDKAFELTRYGKASDEQFAQHIELLESSARPIPIGSDYLPTEDHRAVEGAKERGGGGRQQLGKYSKAHSDQAYRICEERALAGKSADYTAVVAAIAEGRTPVFAD